MTPEHQLLPTPAALRAVELAEGNLGAGTDFVDLTMLFYRYSSWASTAHASICSELYR